MHQGENPRHFAFLFATKVVATVAKAALNDLHPFHLMIKGSQWSGFEKPADSMEVIR